MKNNFEPHCLRARWKEKQFQRNQLELNTHITSQNTRCYRHTSTSGVLICKRNPCDFNVSPCIKKYLD